MRECLHHFIGGRWVLSAGDLRHDVINPATEEACAVMVLETRSMSTLRSRLHRLADTSALAMAARAALTGYAIFSS